MALRQTSYSNSILQSHVSWIIRTSCEGLTTKLHCNCGMINADMYTVVGCAAIIRVTAGTSSSTTVLLLLVSTTVWALSARCQLDMLARIVEAAVLVAAKAFPHQLVQLIDLLPQVLAASARSCTYGSAKQRPAAEPQPLELRSCVGG